MPFRQGNRTKELFFIIAQLDRQQDADNSTDGKGKGKRKAEEVALLPPYVPGFSFIPIPGAPWWLCNVDMAFHAVFLYLVGSVVYVAASFYTWKLPGLPADDDAPNTPGNYLNLLAAILFVFNALVCFVDWWLQLKQLSFLNLQVGEEAAEENTAVKIQAVAISSQQMNYYMLNNIFFMLAALMYTIQGVWMNNKQLDTFNCLSSFCGSFWLNFWGSFFYLVSSMFSLLEYRESIRERAACNLPPMPLFSCTFLDVDWNGWGDLLYFLASLAPLIQAFLYGYVSQDPYIAGPTNIVGNSLFLLDSIAYMFGYLIFIYQLRKDLISGVIDSKRANLLITGGDRDEEMQQNNPLVPSAMAATRTAAGSKALNSATDVDVESGAENAARCDSEASDAPSSRASIEAEAAAVAAAAEAKLTADALVKAFEASLPQQMTLAEIKSSLINRRAQRASLDSTSMRSADSLSFNSTVSKKSRASFGGTSSAKLHTENVTPITITTATGKAPIESVGVGVAAEGSKGGLKEALISGQRSS